MNKLNKLETVLEQYHEGIVNRKEFVAFVGDMSPAEIVDDILNMHDTNMHVVDAEKDVLHSHYALVLATIEAMFKDIKMLRTGGPVSYAQKDLMQMHDATTHEGARKAIATILSLDAGIRLQCTEDMEMIEDRLRTIRQRDKQMQKQRGIMSNMNAELVACEDVKWHLDFMVERLLGRGGGVMVCKNMAFDNPSD